MPEEVRLLSRRDFYERRLDAQMERTFKALITMRDLAERRTRLSDIPWSGGKDGWTLDEPEAAAA